MSDKEVELSRDQAVALVAQGVPTDGPPVRRTNLIRRSLRLDAPSLLGCKLPARS